MADILCFVLGVDTIAPSSNNTGVGGECMPGFYCPEGSGRPISCPPGDYRFANRTLLDVNLFEQLK